MNWEFLDGFTFSQYLVRIVLKSPAQFNWFHGPALYSLLCRALRRHPLGPEIVLCPVESGNIDYRENESYHFGVTLIGPAGNFLESLTEGLRREGGDPPSSDIFPFEVALLICSNIFLAV